MQAKWLAKTGAFEGTFTTSDAIPWEPVDPKHPGLMMFVVWGNPNEGASVILQKFPAGMDSGWHWHTAAYEGVLRSKIWRSFGRRTRSLNSPAARFAVH
jgi:hypothetical protein